MANKMKVLSFPFEIYLMDSFARAGLTKIEELFTVIPWLPKDFRW